MCVRGVGSGVSCDPGGHGGGGGGASSPAPGIRAIGAFGRERGRRASRVPASLSGPTGAREAWMAVELCGRAQWRGARRGGHRP